MREGELCRAHAGRLAGLYRRYFRPEELEALDAAEHTGSLHDEIAALRVALARALREEEDAARLVDTISKGVGAIVRAVRAEHLVSGAGAEDLVQATNRILADLGLGEEGR